MKKLIRLSLIITTVIQLTYTSHAQDSSAVIQFADSLFSKGLQDSLIPGGIVSVIINGEPVLIKGYGLADIKKRVSVSEKNTLFQAGSVGKVFTAMAVLKLVEQGKLDLETDIGRYLNERSNIPPESGKLTLVHLLTHSAGINEQVIGYAAKSAGAILPLEQFLEERFPGYFQQPGESISYSNYGYGVAGLIAEKASGASFIEFVENEILKPAGMLNSTYELEESENYAAGYRPYGAGFVKQPQFYTHTKPAGGLTTTAEDMTRFMIMVLSGGRSQDRLILQKESIDLMMSRQFSNHDILPGYTLGLEEQNLKGMNAVAKGGATLGFTSVLLLVPEQRTGIFLSTNVRNDDFIENFVEEFTWKFIIPGEETISNPDYTGNLDPSRYTGVYRSNRYNHDTIENLPALFRDNISVRVSETGNLTIFSGGNRREYKSIENLKFININPPHDKIVFTEESGGEIVSMFGSSRFAGISVPSSYEKVGLLFNPTFINEFFLSFIPVYLALYILYPVLWLLIIAVRKVFKRDKPKNAIPVIVHGLGFIFGFLSTTYVFKYVAQINHLGSTLAFGIPESLRKFEYIPPALIIITVVLFCVIINIWSKKSGNYFGRIFLSSYIITAIVFILFLNQWNFITLPF